MSPDEVQWGPAVVVLVAGLVLGAAAVWRLRRRASRPAPALPGPSAELRDLDGTIERLLLQLRELDDTASKRSIAQLAQERYALELQAARALQAREQVTPASPEPGRDQAVSPAAEPSSSAASRAGLRGFLWGAGTVAGAGLLLFLVSRAAKPRMEGGGLTGETPGQSAPASEAPDAGEAQARAALARNPEDPDARLDLARELLGRRDLMGVWNETQFVLSRVPGHPRALSYQALVRLAMGQGEVAERMLKEAIAADPGLLEARQHLAFVYFRLDRRADAEATIAEISRRFPGEGERLRQALAQVEAESDAGPADASDSRGESPDEGKGAPADSTVATAGRTPDAASPSVSGVIDADGAVRARIARGTPIFVTVREAGVDKGPPVAVKRLVASGFPLPFALGQADSMMGQPLPTRMRLEVRADSDGDPMTRPASDPSARLDGVAAGSAGLRLALQ